MAVCEFLTVTLRKGDCLPGSDVSSPDLQDTGIAVNSQARPYQNHPFESTPPNLLHHSVMQG